MKAWILTVLTVAVVGGAALLEKSPDLTQHDDAVVLVVNDLAPAGAANFFTLTDDELTAVTPHLDVGLREVVDVDGVMRLAELEHEMNRFTRGRDFVPPDRPTRRSIADTIVRPFAYPLLC